MSRKLLVFILTICVFSVVGCTKKKSQDADVVVRLAYTAKIHYAPQILALENGWFNAPGVKVKGINLGMTAGVAAAEAISSGSADIAVMGDVPSIFSVAGHKDCVLVASYGGGENMHSIIVKDKSDIINAQDLKGKRLGVQFGSSTHGAVYLYLKHNNIDLSTVTLVNVAQKDLIESLISGSIDALAASEPTPMLALEKVPGAKKLAVMSGLNNEFPLMIVASRDFVDNHPEAVRAIVNGTKKGVDYINKDTTLAGAEISVITGASPELEKDSLDSLLWYVRMDDDVINSLNMTAEFLHSIEKLNTVPNLRNHSTFEFVN